MATNWQVLGERADNDGVSALLNDEGIGRVAAVSINAVQSTFVVWGDRNDSTVIEGHVWSFLGETPSNSEARNFLQNSSAAGGAVSVNVHSVWVVWGYVKN